MRAQQQRDGVGHLHRLLAVADAMPDAPAVSDHDGVLSYRELLVRARLIAQCLRSQELEREEPVIVSLERSKSYVAAVVGVALAGAVYVPVDPNDPPYRRRLIVGASGARLAIGDVSGSLDESLTVIDPLMEVSPGIPTVEPVSMHAEPNDLAYILFTSGSTGLPKGVELENRCLDSFLSGSSIWAGLTENDVVACFHAFTFDISIWELWGALTHGAELVIVPRLAQLDACSLHRLVTEQGVTRLCQTPSALRQFAAVVAREGVPPRLHSLLICGERLDFAWLRPFAERIRSRQLTVWNLYGPTETTIYATGHVVTAEEVLSERRSLIGNALPHVAVRVVNSEGRECTAGETGEIVISGVGVGRGYRNLDDSRFAVQDGVSSFSSGDLARYVTDPGSTEIEFIGRAEGFVKIRGYRVEPDEIAAALSLHDDVEDAAAVDIDFLQDGRAIAAAIILSEGSTVTERTLRLFLAERLPHYARPARVVQVDHLPLLASGKLDRPALRTLIEASVSLPVEKVQG